MAINAEWKRRKTEEDKKIVKITTLDPQKDKRKDNESQRRWIKKGNERGWVYSMRICTCSPYLEIAVKRRFDLFVPVEEEQLSLKTGPLTPTARNVWKRRRLSFPIFWVERDEDFLIKKDSLLWVKQKNKLKKKKKRVQSAIALIVVSWPDEASLCGMVAEECWPGASFWRRDGSVDDSHLVFSECSQQSPLWTLTLACNWKCNHN